MLLLDWSSNKKPNKKQNIYIQNFVNFKDNSEARLLLILVLEYKNDNYINNSNITFKLNCTYHICILFEKNTNFCFNLITLNKLGIKLQEFFIIYYKNLYNAKKFWKKLIKKTLSLKAIFWWQSLAE